MPLPGNLLPPAVPQQNPSDDTGFPLHFRQTLKEKFLKSYILLLPATKVKNPLSLACKCEDRYCCGIKTKTGKNVLRQCPWSTIYSILLLLRVCSSARWSSAGQGTRWQMVPVFLRAHSGALRVGYQDRQNVHLSVRAKLLW